MKVSKKLRDKIYDMIYNTILEDNSILTIRDSNYATERIVNVLEMFEVEDKPNYYTYTWVYSFVLHVNRGRVRKRHIEYYKQTYTAQNNAVVVWKKDLKTGKALKTYRKRVEKE